MTFHSLNKIHFPILLTFLIYFIGFFWAKDFVYFWDNILQTSIEAHKIYTLGFNPIDFLTHNEFNHIHSTGYHPPLLAFITAILWKYVAYKLWVSHGLAFIACCLLLYHLYQLLKFFVPEKWIGWLILILLLEPTVLTQYTIASPDFFILTFLIMAISQIVREKWRFLPLVLVFLFGMSMRGTFLGIILLMAHFLYQTNFQQFKKWTLKDFAIVKYYLPAVILLGTYFALYLYTNGWFFKNQGADGHYALPRNVYIIIKHFIEFGVRSVENGRILLWLLAVLLFFKWFSGKIRLTQVQKLVFTVALLHFGLYFLFIFIVQVPFSGRYFIPHFILMSILVLSYLINNTNSKKSMLYILIVLALEISGHFWIYPDPIAKAWDTTLAHVPYYDLRKQALAYVEKTNIDYHELSGGFCLTTDQQFVDLLPPSRIIGNDLTTKYFLYSNISNLTDDILQQLQNPQLWQIEKKFTKGAVEIILYRKR